MDYINERVAYIKGLAEGLDLSSESKEGKVINSIIDILEDIADALSDIEDSHEELSEYVESIDEGLANVEEDMLDEYDDEEYIEVECPKCNEIVYFDEDMFENGEEEVLCPNCHKPIYVEDEEEDKE